MLNTSLPPHDADFMLSPTETEERKARTFTLKKIDQEIERIMSLNNVQSQHYKEFMEKIVFIEDVYKKQNAALKQSLQVMTEKYQSLQKMYLSLKEELQDNFSNSEVVVEQNQMLNKQVAKLKTMIHNQQNLIDEYRKNIQEQLTLQKQFLKSEFDEQKTKLTREFNKILIQIQKQQQQKIKKISQQTKLKQYRVDYKDVKKYLLNKQNSQKQLIKSESKPIKPNHSEYSTTDQENRHNQPIYFL